MNREEIDHNEILIGDMKLLDHLATVHARQREDHPLQETLERILEDTLTPEEHELFLLRFGEQLPFRQIAERMGYKSHQTFQLKINEIIRKVREELGRSNIRDAQSTD
jgi:DNA-directed RNA polymerase specialized sigma24 family protein